ncbi:MAG TPA: prepilin-type N-terminal cleavage/methylation domain-containing protein [Pyrinomonadaceae bacterium]|jgi:Tfp pilus assembly protein FimT
MKGNKKNSELGFSLVELLIVLLITMIMIAITGFYFLNHQKLYKPDDQSLKIVDMLQEARQRSLTQRETVRVEIDLTDNLIRLIDENTPATVNDDREIRRTTLLPQSEVKLQQRPDDISYNPPETLPAPTAVFTTSVYPSSSTHNVCTIRFQSNGTVVNAGTTAVGGGATVTGVTLHIWAPKKTNANEADIARAITIIGSTGSIRMWEFDITNTGTNKWQDSRRTSVYGS